VIVAPAEPAGAKAAAERVLVWKRDEQHRPARVGALVHLQHAHGHELRHSAGVEAAAHSEEHAAADLPALTMARPVAGAGRVLGLRE
jgi:hypothetical protein